MGAMVTSGAVMKCSFGIAPCPFQAMANATVLSGMPAGTMLDISPASIATFGMCQSMANPTVASATAAALGVLAPMPCLPMIAGPWMISSPTVLVKGSPVLTTDARAMCAYGGMLQFISSPAQKVMVK